MISRGSFRCRGNAQNCPFKVRFSWIVQSSCYMVKEVILTHNHDLGQDGRGLDGKQIVHYQHELTEEEFHLLQSLGPARLSVSLVKLILRKNFPTRSFEDQLIYRQQEKGCKRNHLVS